MLVLDALVPVLVGAAIIVGVALHDGGARGPLTYALIVAASVSLYARRVAAGWTVVISGALALVMFIVDPATRPIGALACVVALYSYVSLLRERLDTAERTREQQAKRKVEQERLRIARELHDIVAHTLTTINVQSATAAELLDGRAGGARAALQKIADSSREALRELRAIVGVLRESDGPDVPLAPAPGLDELPALLERAREDGTDVQLDLVGQRPHRLSEAVSLAAYRIVQESLTNARRHAPGAPVRITLAFDSGRLCLAAENRLRSPSPANGAAPGVGITGMIERAVAVGGTLKAMELPDRFRVEAELPYELSDP